MKALLVVRPRFPSGVSRFIPPILIALSVCAGCGVHPDATLRAQYVVASNQFTRTGNMLSDLRAVGVIGDEEWRGLFLPMMETVNGILDEMKAAAVNPATPGWKWHDMNQRLHCEMRRLLLAQAVARARGGPEHGP